MNLHRDQFVSAINGNQYTVSNNQIIETDLSNQIVKYFVGHTNKIVHLFLSDNEEYLISNSDDNSIRIWNIVNGNCVASLPRREDSIIYIKEKNNTFSLLKLDHRSFRKWFSNGTYLCVENQSVYQIFNYKSLKSAVYRSHPVYSITEKNELKFRNIKFQWNEREVYSPNDSFILSTYDNENVMIYKMSYDYSPLLLKSFSCSSKVYSIIWSPCGEYIITSNTDKTIQIWNVCNEPQLIKTINGKTIVFSDHRLTAQKKSIYEVDNTMVVKWYNESRYFLKVKKEETVKIQCVDTDVILDPNWKEILEKL